MPEGAGGVMARGALGDGLAGEGGRTVRGAGERRVGRRLAGFLERRGDLEGDSEAGVLLLDSLLLR